MCWHLARALTARGKRNTITNEPLYIIKPQAHPPSQYSILHTQNSSMASTVYVSALPLRLFSAPRAFNGTRGKHTFFLPSLFPLKLDACLDLFRLVKSDGHPHMEESVDASWEQDPLKTLKLIAHARKINSVDNFYTAALWMRQRHPQTLAINLSSFVKFGHCTDPLNILDKALQQEQSRNYGEANSETLGILHEAVTKFFARTLWADFEYLRNDPKSITDAAKHFPDLGSLEDQKLLIFESVAKKLFPEIHPVSPKLQFEFPHLSPYFDCVIEEEGDRVSLASKKLRDHVLIPLRHHCTVVENVCEKRKNIPYPAPLDTSEVVHTMSEAWETREDTGKESDLHLLDLMTMAEEELCEKPVETESEALAVMDIVLELYKGFTVVD